MIEERNEIPLEELDKDVSKGKYLLVKKGGYHPFYEVKQAPEKYRQNIWPWIKKIGGNLQHKKKLGKINGSVSIKKPYINYTVEKDVERFGYDKKGRPNRKKSYLHLIVGKAFVPNPRGLIHQSDGGDGVVALLPRRCWSGHCNPLPGLQILSLTSLWGAGVLRQRGR